MSWEKVDLWPKAVLYMEYASAVDKDSPQFGLWCALSLEILARSAIANINPVLLAEPDRDHKHLLNILGLSSLPGHSAKSIGTVQVLSLCKILIPNFLDEDFKFSTSFANMRNEELHTGSAVFATQKSSQWAHSFYRCCKILAEAQSESLESLLGNDEALFAEEILNKKEDAVLKQVRHMITSYQVVFDAKLQSEKDDLAKAAEENSNKLSSQGHHRVTCPACKSMATVTGKAFGAERVINEEDSIVTKRTVLPTDFECTACGLKISGYGILMAIGLGDSFTHRTDYTPQEYYELVDPNDFDAMSYFAEEHGFYHFSND